MPPHRCFIVPPHLLRNLSESPNVPRHVAAAAARSLAHSEKVISTRQSRLVTLAQPHGHRVLASRQPHSITPSYLLRQIAESEAVDDVSRARACRDLQHIEAIAASRQAARDADDPSAKPATSSEARHVVADDAAKSGTTYRAVYDAKHDENEADLPGSLVRAEGQVASAGDSSVNEAYDNVGHVIQFYKDIFNWNSVDNQNMNVLSSVHFGQNYENAFWDPEKLQMVFGDGDHFIGHFTGAIDVIGHEMTHGITEHTTPLDYNGQPGALNEHVSDVFGIMVKQRVENTTAEESDWLIGEACLLPGVAGVALRSMKAPGTAYDDANFGKDPQPANFSDYKPTEDDNGGVHLYSGIPNRAFYLTAVAFGGFSWEKAGRIWWTTMTSGRIAPKSNFMQFADVTVEVAQEMFGDDAAKIVRQAWNDVGVTRAV